MMLEHTVQMGPMLIVAALMVAWLTESFSWSGGRGLVPDMAFGLVGSAAAGAAAWSFVSGDVGMLLMFLVGTLGAVVVIVGQRTLWHAARPAA